MRIFNRTGRSDKENAALWKKEAARLGHERDNLLARLNSIEQYKKDYGKLIDESRLLKERYENLTIATERLFNEYKSKLEQLTS